MTEQFEDRMATVKAWIKNPDGALLVGPDFLSELIRRYEASIAAEGFSRIAGIEESANRIRVMGGWYGLEEKQTDDLAAEIEALPAPPVVEEAAGKEK